MFVESNIGWKKILPITDEKKQIEMLSTENAKKIVSLKTTLVPVQVILIDEEKRGSEFQGLPSHCTK